MLRRLLALVPALVALPLVACAPEEDATEGAGAAQSVAEVDPAALFRDGFKLMTTRSCLDEPGRPECAIALLDSSHRPARAGDTQFASSPFGLNFGTIHLQDQITIGACAGGPNDCYTVYQWPASLPDRDHDAIAAQMREYSKLVGTLLKRQAKGPGEETWLNYARSNANREVYRAAPRGADAFCGAVVKSFVNTMLPEGSDFRQYGNCGEGGHIGACLAYKAGFEEDEIRFCSSDHDHFFAMVQAKDPADKWCVLDRWSLINSDNYACGVDWESDSRTITYKGERVDMQWFTDVTCSTMEDYLRRYGAR